VDERSSGVVLCSLQNRMYSPEDIDRR
jgi:hypothetical protein